MNNKILIVDDHADIRRLVRIALGNEFEILEAEDGATALALIREQQPCIVLLDIMMPGEMDGLEVLQAIKGDPLLMHICVIMLTARAQKQDYDLGAKYGADKYFIKPFSPLRLVDVIHELMHES